MFNKGPHIFILRWDPQILQRALLVSLWGKYCMMVATLHLFPAECSGSSAGRLEIGHGGHWQAPEIRVRTSCKTFTSAPLDRPRSSGLVIIHTHYQPPDTCGV